MIPARLGSKRIKKKNIRLLNGIPLISYAIRAAKESGCFDEIYVNSESDIIGEIANQEGVKFYKRKSNLTTDSATNDDFALDFVNNVKCDILIQILPTSPFITEGEIISFVADMQTNSLDTLISVCEQKIECIYREQPINFVQKDKTPPSQFLEPIKSYACSLMGWKSENFIKNMKKYNSAYHGGDGEIGFFTLKGFSTIDIDNEEDFQLAEAAAMLLSNRQQTEPKYYDPSETFDADRMRVLLEDGVINNNMHNYNKEVASIDKIMAKNPDDICWSHTLINSKSTCATLIAQMPGEGNRLHYHNNWDEWWYIVKGEWEWHVEGRNLKVRQGDIVFIERGKLHKITACGNGQSIRLAVSREDIDHIYPRGDFNGEN